MESHATIAWITCRDHDQAVLIGRSLVEEQLAACVNILDGMESIFSWQGTLETARECVLVAKTFSHLSERLTKRVVALHTYEVPCVLFMPVTGGNPAFLDWMNAQAGRQVR